jgi:BirA family biotin operon repressor/biotin-[acetyl-CoA-carboxylase] ligase
MIGDEPCLPPGWKLRAFEALDSTNAEALRLAAAGTRGRTAVWARWQSAGRGRRGRVWESPTGNLYVSFLLRPDVAPAEAAQLGFVAALAVADTVSGLLPGAEATLKWPNDVLLDGEKVAGILLESAAGPRGGVQAIVVGIGINIAAAPRQARTPATSLHAAGAPAALDDRGVLEALTVAFAGWIERWERAGFQPLREAWLERAIGLGEAVEARLPETILRGQFEDLDHDGTLLLRQADGRLRRVTAGDVYVTSGEGAHASRH